MLTYDDIKEFFGGSDKSPFEILIDIDIKLGTFGEFDLFDAFRYPCENRWTENDWISSYNAIASTFGGKTYGYVKEASKSMYHSNFIFRNLYRIIFETDRFDDIILGESFVKRLKNLAMRFSRKYAKRNEYYSQSFADNFDTIMEFVDKIEKKKRKHTNDN